MKSSSIMNTVGFTERGTVTGVSGDAPIWKTFFSLAAFEWMQLKHLQKNPHQELNQCYGFPAFLEGQSHVGPIERQQTDALKVELWVLYQRKGLRRKEGLRIEGYLTLYWNLLQQHSRWRKAAQKDGSWPWLTIRVTVFYLTYSFLRWPSLFVCIFFKWLWDECPGLPFYWNPKQTSKKKTPASTSRHTFKRQLLEQSKMHFVSFTKSS